MLSCQACSFKQSVFRQNYKGAKTYEYKNSPFKVTVRYCKKRTKLKKQKNEEKQKMRELLFGNSPNYLQPSPNAPPPTYQHSYSTPVYHHQLDNFNGFNPTMRYSMRSERGLPISQVLQDLKS